jgi:hypothetical protein
MQPAGIPIHDMDAIIRKRAMSYWAQSTAGL